MHRYVTERYLFWYLRSNGKRLAAIRNCDSEKPSRIKNSAVLLIHHDSRNTDVAENMSITKHLCHIITIQVGESFNEIHVKAESRRRLLTEASERNIDLFYLT